MMARAHTRLRARELLRQGQLIIAGLGDKDGWRMKQRELIREMKH